MLALGDGSHSDPVQIVGSDPKGRELGDRWSAGLETVRGLGIGGARHVHDLDHLPTTQEGWQVVEQVVAPPQDADASGAEHLVAGEGEQVRPEFGDVHGHLWHGLGGIDDDDRAHLMRPLGDALHRVDRAQHVGGQGQ